MKRINFLETGAFQLTYRRMLVMFVGATALTGLLFIGFHLKNVYVEKRVKTLSGEIAELKGEQQALLADVDGARELVNKKTREVLEEEFSILPSWAPLFREVAGKVPPDLWLTLLEGKREASPGEAELILKGVTLRTARLTEFIRKLGQGAYLERPTLAETRVTFLNGKPAYEFTIDCEVISL